MTRVLFIPRVESLASSERASMMYRTLAADQEVFGLPAPRDRILYDTSRAKAPRYLLYLIDKVLLTLQGLRLARRNRVEVVVAETAHHALAGLLVARIRGVRCLWDSHGNVKLFSESVGKGRLFTRLAVLLESFLGRRVDTLITVSDTDAEAYALMGVPPSKIEVIPLSLHLAEVEYRARPGGETEGSPVLLFFGSFKYAPNREALRFIDQSMAPYLEGQGLECRINIAGRDIPERPFHPFVNVLGFVPDIHDAIRETDLCVVPVWSGVGTLTKVLDIMAVGTPSVLSSFAAQGIAGLEDGVHAWVAASQEEFLQSVSQALAAPGQGTEMGEAARRLMEARYDWGVQVPRLNRLVGGDPPDS